MAVTTVQEMDAENELAGIMLDQSDRFFERALDAETRKRAEKGEWLPGLWSAVEEIGLPLAMVGENAGGLGLSAIDASRLLRRLGYRSCPLPIGETILAAAIWSAATGRLAEGPLAIADGHDLRLEALDGIYRVSGTVPGVPWPEAAAGLMVTVRHPAGGDALLLLPREWRVAKARLDMASEPRGTIQLDHITLDGDRVHRCSKPLDLRAQGAFLRAQQMVGAIERCLDLTLEHLKTRRQFGRTLSQFQAIQHQIAAAAGERALAVASADIAARNYCGPAFELGVAAAKSCVGEAAGKVAAVAHQLHGALGYTREHEIHLATRRLWAWRDEFGSEQHWQAVLGRFAFDQPGTMLWPRLVANAQSVVDQPA